MRGARHGYAYMGETFEWRTEPMIEAEKNDEGVYVITTVTREARQAWRTNPQTNPEPFRTAAARWRQSQQPRT